MRENTNTTNVRYRSAIGALALGGGLLLLAGCASPSVEHTNAWRGHRAAAAMPMPGIYRYGPVADARYPGGNVGAEVSRLNNDLSARQRAPFSALGQWPEALPPREDPVRFERWRQ